MYPANSGSKTDTPKNAMVNEGGFVDSTSRGVMNEVGKCERGDKKGVIALAKRYGCDIRNMVSSAGRDLHTVKHNMGAFIRNRPVQSSIMAVGLGVVVGMLARR